ncbi:MAG: methylmalonyl Co-A mutase-associated GTPase MeaB, partial [Bacteroidota bacterium]
MDSTFRRISKNHLQDLIKGILDGERAFLSRGITLVESKKAEDQQMSAELIDQIIEKRTDSFRIGITGVPGVGKSTFIDSFGSMLTNSGKKVA